VVEIAPCGKAMCGRIAKILKPTPGGPTTDVKNPDKALRSRPIQNLVILSGFTDAGDHWKGQLYDPRRGLSVRGELRREGGVLKVKGCYGPFCQSQDWRAAS
jgi:uncharacterized protein (DUF2147 family)